MNEVVPWHFYLPMLAATSENKFYITKNIALSDRRGFKNIQDSTFEQFGGKHRQILSISKKNVFDVLIAT